MIDAINNLPSPWNIIAWIGCAIAIMVVVLILIKLNKLVFQRIQKKHRTVNLLFFQHLNSILIVVGSIILIVSSLSGFQSVWQTMLGGTAILSAVIAFAAQDVIKDILAGMMISLHKPFKIGDRITLEDGLSGIVEDITIRHVILRTIDTTRHIIPNSKINSSRIVNLSYERNNRSAEFEFAIGYDSDMKLAKSVIKDAIEKSEYSIPESIEKDDDAQYSNVYFMRFDASALILHTTVFFDNNVPPEKLIDDINMRVREALIANNIEIPYNYINVVTKPNEKTQIKEDMNQK